MSIGAPLPFFQPKLPDPARIISWTHIGDLHMTNAGEQNDLDLIAIVDEINRRFAGQISFVYIPGDVADDGSASAYVVVRNALDYLQAPWCSVIGDHDVQEKSFTNYLSFMAHAKHYSFVIVAVRFVALNAFDIPDPGSFSLLDKQLDWLEEEIRRPSGSGSQLSFCCTAIPPISSREENVSEGSSQRHQFVSSTWATLTTTNSRTTDKRSTLQHVQQARLRRDRSASHIDGAVISWKFFLLDELPVVMITSPADERFITDASLEGHVAESKIVVRAKAWANGQIRKVDASLGEQDVPMYQISESNVWQVDLERGSLADGVYQLTVAATDENGQTAEDSIRLVLGASAYKSQRRSERDQDNAVEAWPERGLLGTQLGPNKNGRKW